MQKLPPIPVVSVFVSDARRSSQNFQHLVDDDGFDGSSEVASKGIFSVPFLSIESRDADTAPDLLAIPR